MNRMEGEGESCQSERRDFPGKSDEIQNHRCLIRRHVRSAGCTEKRSPVLIFGHFRQPANGMNEYDR